MGQQRKTGAKHARGGGARLVYDALKKEILCLTLRPGEPLDETSLAARFSLSRSPVREALVRLSAEGLVVMLSNRSTLVAPIQISDFPRYVEALDFLQRINTRLAAQHRTQAELEQMRNAATLFETACAQNDILAMSAGNRDFHISVAQAGKNPYLTRQYGQLLDEGRRILHMHFDFISASAGDRLLDNEHREMIAAIEAQDVALADRLAHAHTRQFHDRFIAFLSSRYEEDFDFDLSFEPRKSAP